ncbi:hypothetical protein OKW49_002817 [Paraburkholderia youngii]
MRPTSVAPHSLCTSSCSLPDAGQPRRHRIWQISAFREVLKHPRRGRPAALLQSSAKDERKCPKVVASVQRLEVLNGFCYRLQHGVLVQRARDMRGGSRQFHLVDLQTCCRFKGAVSSGWLHHLDTPGSAKKRTFRMRESAQRRDCDRDAERPANIRTNRQGRELRAPPFVMRCESGSPGLPSAKPVNVELEDRGKARAGVQRRHSDSASPIFHLIFTDTEPVSCACRTDASPLQCPVQACGQRASEAVVPGTTLEMTDAFGMRTHHVTALSPIYVFMRFATSSSGCAPQATCS